MRESLILKKKQKLRNNEYYNIQDKFDDLYNEATKGREFNKLMDIISSKENILLAYRNIKNNKGSTTLGTDKMDISFYKKWDEERFVKYFQGKFNNYEPKSVRRVEIPKPNGKTRPLGIPCMNDRIIQQCIKQVLEPICESKFHRHSYGFRPNRSTHHAIARSMQLINISKLHYVIDIDIKGFFDNVDHGKLLKQIWTLGIRDKRLLSIISAMLKAEIKGIGIPEKGTPQGGILSPLLSNIVLNELDWWIASQWEEMPPKHNKPFIRKDNGKVDKAPIFSAYRERSNLKECHLVRYADDFKIFCRKRSDANKIFEAVKQWLRDRLHLEISEEKSTITNLKRHYSEFLGFRIRLVQKGKTKSGSPRYTVKSHISEKAKIRIKNGLHKQIKSVQKPIGKRSGHTSVDCYNAYVMGVHNYYKIATQAAADFYKISYSSYKSLITRLKKRLKKTGTRLLPYIKEKYGDSKQIRYVYDTALVPIGCINHKPPSMLRVNVNKYTPEGRVNIHRQLEAINLLILTYIMRNPVKGKSIEYNDNRLSLYCGQGGKCAVSKMPLEIGHMHCHHITPIKLGGDDRYSNLLFVTDKVHILIHATAEETIKALLYELRLDKKQLAKLNKLRQMAGLNEII